MHLSRAHTEVVTTVHSIGGALKAWRQQSGLSQKDAAAHFGVPSRTYQDYERDLKAPGAGAIEAFVRAGINANWLLTGDGEMLSSGAVKSSSVQSQSMVAQDVAPYSVNVSVDSQAKPEISSMVARCIVAAESITEGRLDRHQQVSFGLDVWGALQRLAGSADAAARLAGLTDADLEQLARLVMNIRSCSASK